MPRPLPSHFGHLNALLQQLTSLASSELPFVSWIAGSDTIHVACAKTVVAKVFKLLHSKQKELGVTVKDVKTNIITQSATQQEADELCSKVALATLQHRGWVQLNTNHLLGGNLIDLADGTLQELESLQIRAHAQQPDTIMLLVKAEVVKFRHTAVRDIIDGDLTRLGSYLQGRCTVLPHFRDGLMCGACPADAATLERLRPLWASYGFQLPALVPYLVNVCFEEDQDAPVFPYPPCCVLSQSGLDPVHSRLDSSPVQSLLARLRDDLANASFKFWGSSNLKLSSARVWHPEGLPATHQARQQPEPPAPVFQSAKEMQRQAATPALALGPKLASFLKKIEEEEAAAVVQAAAKKAAAAPPAAPKPIPTCKPALPGGPALVPSFKTSVIPGGAPTKPLKTAGQKRPAGTAAPAKPRAPKAVKPAAAGGARPSTAAAAAGPAAIAATNSVAPSEPVQPGTAAAAAPAAAPKPAKPKAPAMPLEEVVKKVLSSHAAGKLSALTMDQMKAYLKSVKKPVGGKKADLEERVRQHLQTAEA
ncbi:hypothetical protein N2152v2_007796 [Parachlorella kessleri]